MKTTSTIFRIQNTTSGQDFGFYRADTREDALDAFARDAGYRSFGDLCEVTEDDGSDLDVRESDLGPCPRCGCDSYMLDDGDMRCEQCGLVHGEDFDDDEE